MISRNPIKFTLGGTPVPNRGPDAPVSASNDGVRSPSARSSSPSPAPAAVREPLVAEVLPKELTVQNLHGDALAEAAKSGSLFACLRNEATSSSGSSWLAVFDSADAPVSANGSEPRRMSAFRVQRRPGTQLSAPEAATELRQLLAESGLSPWPLVVGEEELVLVDYAKMLVAAHALIAAGHAVGPPLHLSPQPQVDGDLKADVAEKLCGAWRLLRRERSSIGGVQNFGRTDGPLRIISPSGVYAEVSVQNPGEVSGQASSCGVLSAEEADDQLIVMRHAAVSFEPPIGGARSSRIVFEKGDDGQDIAVETLIDGDKGSEIDRWERVGNGEVTVLELACMVSKQTVDAKPAGHWLFCGSVWARVTGLPHGSGLVASKCCRSLEAAQALFGEEEVASELRAQFSASCGSIDRPGHLSISRQSWSSKEETLFDAKHNANEVRKEGDSICHAPGGGITSHWNVRSFVLDPFTPAPEPDSDHEEKKKDASSDSDSDKESKASKASKASKKSDDSSASKKSEAKKKKKKEAKSDSDSDSSKASGKKEKDDESDKEKDKKKKEKKSRSSSSDSSKPRKKEKRGKSRSKSNDRSKSKRKKSRSRSRSKDKKSKDRDRSRSKDKKDRSRSRGRRDRDRSKSKDRKKSRSRDRDRDRRNRSRDRKKSRSRDRKRSRSRDKDKRGRSRDKSRDKRKKGRSRSRSRSKDKKSKDRSKSRDKKKDRSRSEEKKSSKKKAKSSSDSDSDDKKKKKKRSKSDSSDEKDKKNEKDKKSDSGKKSKKGGSDSSSEAAKKSDSDSDAKKSSDKKSEKKNGEKTELIKDSDDSASS